MWVILSLDGVGEYHDRSRAHSGLYEELAARFYKTHRSKRTLTTTTLHTGNADQSAKLLEQWRDADILGMTFEFATPIGRAANPQLDLIGDARNKVIDDLIRLKKKYGGFMKNSVWGFEMQRPENLASWVGEKNCPTAKFSISFDSLGRRKRPCVLGSNAENPLGKKPNCSACGCHVPTVLEGVRRLDRQTLQSAFWFLN